MCSAFVVYNFTPFFTFLNLSVKSAGFSEEITSVCSTVLSTYDKEEISVPNPYVHKGTAISSTTATPTTFDSQSSESPTSKSPSSDSSPATKEIEATSETLLEHSEKDESTSNNTLSEEVKKRNGSSGPASKIYKTLYLFMMLFTLLIGLA